MAEGFGDGECSDAVIESSGSGAVAEEVLEFPLIGHAVANHDVFFYFIFTGCANIDIHVAHIGAFVLFTVFEQVDGFATDDAGYFFASVNEDSVANWNHGVVSADASEIDKTLVVDVVDLEADFVHVSGEHDFLVGLGIKDSVDVAVLIGADFVGKGFGVIAIDLGGSFFIAGWGGGVAEGFEEIEGF